MAWFSRWIRVIWRNSLSSRFFSLSCVRSEVWSPDFERLGPDLYKCNRCTWTFSFIYKLESYFHTFKWTHRMPIPPEIETQKTCRSVRGNIPEAKIKRSHTVQIWLTMPILHAITPVETFSWRKEICIWFNPNLDGARYPRFLLGRQIRSIGRPVWYWNAFQTNNHHCPTSPQMRHVIWNDIHFRDHYVHVTIHCPRCRTQSMTMMTPRQRRGSILVWAMIRERVWLNAD
jgi:hypothetical protein